MTPRAAASVSAVVVSYRTGPSLWTCLERLRADPAVRDVVVVDNGNDAPTVARLAAEAAAGALRLVSGHGNVGFATGCHLGVDATAGEHVLLVNPDCLVEPGSIGALRDAVLAEAAPAALWIATVRLLEPDGREQRGCRRNAGTPGQCLAEALQLHRWLPAALRPARLNLDEAPLPDRITTVPAISGAFMLMPRATWTAVGGMDRGYFLHVEDLDFCRRLADRGGRAFFVPWLSATHVKGTSAASPLFVERHKIAGFRRYFRAHAVSWPGRLAAELAWVALAAGLLLRAALSGRRRRDAG